MTGAGTKLETADLQPAEPTLDTHAFADKIVDVTVNFTVLRLRDSFFLWVGSTPEFSNLAMAMVTRFSTSPIGSNILGDASDPNSVALAQKLSKKTGKQVFVSLNLTTDNMSLPLVEKRVFEELKQNPDKF